MRAEEHRHEALVPPSSSLEEERPRAHSGLVSRDERGVVRLSLADGAASPARSTALPAAAAARPQQAPALAPVGAWVRDIVALEAVIATWGEQERRTVAALERAIDALHKEALTRLIRSLRGSPEAALALKQAAADPVVYAVLRQHELVRASLEERVEAALDSVRPSLAAHGGDVELVAIPAPDTVTIRLLGSCDGCASAEQTLSAGVERAIRERCPEVRQIERAPSGLRAPPSGIQYQSPFAREGEGGWVRVARLEQIADGNLLPVVIGSRSLLLTRTAERVSCFDNACAHLGMPLDQADVQGGVLTCPHHHFQFSLESGECLTVPEVQLQAHATRVRGGDVEVQLA